MHPTIWLLRRDLRLTDNPALTAAAEAGPVAALFWIDDVLRAQGAATRWRLARSLEALDRDLRGQGGGLWAVDGDLQAMLAAVRAIGARAIHVCAWPERQRAAADAALGAALSSDGRVLTLHDGLTLIPPWRVTTAQGGAFRVYSAFARAARRIGVAPPLPRPARIDWIAPPPDRALGAAVLAALDAGMNRGAAVLAAHAPPAGEAAALSRLTGFAARGAGYAAERDRPDRPEATSSLSDALAVGELSPRTVWTVADRIEADGSAAAAEKFRSELLWRDFAWSLLVASPDMDRAEWAPRFAGFPWRGASPDLTAWQQAVTGEPLVDAGLRELFVTGRMHNRVRMVVASYLTKHLLTDWRLGLDWFADTLIDWDPASNSMNWQWVAGTGPDAAPYFRIYNPATQAEKFDPDAIYRRRWLAGWQGSTSDDARAYFKAVPRSWGLTADQPYPARPIVALAEGRQRALDALASLG